MRFEGNIWDEDTRAHLGVILGPGQGAATYGSATTDKVAVFGLSWERSGRSSKHIPFEWSSEDEF